MARISNAWPESATKGSAARVVVITGGSSGIGRSAARVFARHGFRVGLIARGRPGLLAARDDVARIGGVAAMAQADVADGDALEAATRELEAALGPIGVWVNCAGNGTFGRFLDTPAEEFRRVTDVTYLGTVNGTRVALSRMVPRDSGRVISVCSAVAFHGMPLLASYSGAKHAIHGFNQAVRAELAQDRSRVTLTTVFPPAVNSPFFEHAVSHMGRPGRPMRPVYQPEIVADAIYLAAMTGPRLMPVSSAAVLFSIAARVAPALVGWGIRRLGFDGQLTSDPAPLARYEPTLFAPSERVSCVHGAFDAQARTGSLHVRLLSAWARLAGQRVNVSAEGPPRSCVPQALVWPDPPAQQAGPALPAGSVAQQYDA